MRDLLIGVAVTAVVTLPLAVLGATAPLLRADLGLGEAAFGGLVALFFLSGAVVSIPAGPVSRTIGLRPMILASCATTLVCLAVISGWVGSWWPLAIALLAAGMANSTGQVAVNQWLTQHRPADRQGLAFGAKQAAVPLAVLSAGILLPLVVVPNGWRAGYLAAGAISLAGLLAVWWLTGRAPRISREGIDRRRLSFSRPVIMLSIVGVLGSAGGTCLSPFLVDYVTSRDLGIEAAGILLVIGAAAGIVARVLAGFAADRLQIGPLTIMRTLLGGGAVGIAFFALGITGVAWVPAVVLAFAGAWGWAGLLPFALARIAPAEFASGVGMIVMAQLTGAVVGPALFGALVEGSGYPVAWTVLVGFVGTAALLTVAVGPRSPAPVPATG